MPKKTRKEKLLAQQRRHTSSPSSISQAAQASVPVSTLSSSTFRFQATHVKKLSPIADAEDKAELTIIKSDLSKTLILACIAIAVEVALYYWLLNVK